MSQRIFYLIGPNSIVNIDFFNFDTTNDATKTFRENVAVWYYALRNLSVIISLVVLIYVGIRMAISTIAEEKAKYKQMLTNWLVGFILIFFIHYIIIIIIKFNNVLVAIIHTTDGAPFGTFQRSLLKGMFNISFIKGLTSILCYLCCVGITIALFFAYMKRMLTIGFLIVISPLITITYAIDKMGDGKSQALNTWLTEFVFGVLIQPFQCIIYIVFAGTAVKLLGTVTSNAIGTGILAIACMTFIFKAEEIVKKIFGFEKASSVASAAAAGAVVGSAASKAFGKSKGKAGSGGSGGAGLGAKLSNKAKSMASKVKESVKTNGVIGATVNAVKDGAKKVGDRLRNIKDDPKAATKSAARFTGKAALAGAKEAGRFAKKYGGGIAVGAIVTGATGNAATGVGVGYAMSGKDKSDGINKKEVVKQKEQLKTAYDDYKNSNSLSDEDMETKAKELLYKKDLISITDPKELEYAKQLHNTKKMYKDSGQEKKPGKQVIKDVVQIKNANITRDKLQGVEQARNAYKIKNPSVNLTSMENDTYDALTSDKREKHLDTVEKGSDQELKDYTKAMDEYIQHISKITMEEDE